MYNVNSPPHGGRTDAMSPYLGEAGVVGLLLSHAGRHAALVVVGGVDRRVVGQRKDALVHRPIQHAGTWDTRHRDQRLGVCRTCDEGWEGVCRMVTVPAASLLEVRPAASADEQRLSRKARSTTSIYLNLSCRVILVKPRDG